MKLVMTIEETIKPKSSKPIQYTVTEDGCWVCISHTLDKDGYPKLRRGQRYWLMHRYVFTLARGEIPEGFNILHNCDNPSCINYQHMRIGTQADNMRDKMIRGRYNRNALTEKQVREIRKDERSYYEIGKSYGVTGNFIRKIKKGNSWKHVR